jgi:hypothetical protein
MGNAMAATPTVVSVLVARADRFGLCGIGRSSQAAQRLDCGRHRRNRDSAANVGWAKVRVAGRHRAGVHRGDEWFMRAARGVAS